MKKMRTLGIVILNEKGCENGRLIKFMTRIGKLKGFNVLIGGVDSYSNGKLKKAYEYYNGKGRVVRNRKVDVLFDFALKNKKWDKIKEKIKNEIKIFNHPELNKICWDKYRCSKVFSQFMNETFLVNNKRQLKEAIKKIDSYWILIKPRFGIKGRNIMLITRDNPVDVEKNSVVQKFVDSSNGIPCLDVEGVHDLRVVTLSGRIDHAYIRSPKEGFIANVARGGHSTYISKAKLPENVVQIVRKIDKRMKRYGPRLYTVDMVFDENNKPVVIELESVPAINYRSPSLKKVHGGFIKRIFDTILELK